MIYFVIMDEIESKSAGTVAKGFQTALKGNE